MIKKNVSKMALFITFVVILLFTGCKNNNSGENPVNQNAIDVSIIQLISSPKDYKGKTVRVIGIGNLEFEGNAVYLNREDWNNSISKNGLWIELGSSATSYDEAKNWNGKYVIIEGIYKPEKKGHFGMWSGAIIDITRYELWEKD